MSEVSTRKAKPAGDLSAMLLPELRKVATQLGIEGAAKLAKGDLVQAIADLQAANRAAAAKEKEARQLERQQEREERRRERNQGRNQSSEEGNSSDSSDSDDDSSADNSAGSDSEGSSDRNDRGNRNDRNDRDGGRRDRHRDRDRGDRGDRNDRGRDRNRDRGDRGERDMTIREDDVLIPVGGLLDILENYAFVRTAGYLPSPNDVYVSMQQVRRYALRKGDVITGAVREPREGERREKFNALIRLDTINGMDPEESRNRVEFTKLTPLYPQERLRLETLPNVLTTRVIDLIAPIGKGQRGLIVSPPKAGKTMVLQSIANAITTNNPECHLMVVLVDERPKK